MRELPPTQPTWSIYGSYPNWGWIPLTEVKHVLGQNFWRSFWDRMYVLLIGTRATMWAAEDETGRYMEISKADIQSSYNYYHSHERWTKKSWSGFAQ